MFECTIYIKYLINCYNRFSFNKYSCSIFNIELGTMDKDKDVIKENTHQVCIKNTI